MTTVGDLSDRRARKKAQTREQIRRVAHRLFAEHGFDAVTIADIARGADVAVQTVFNHFATKEELFFDGRAPWVEGPAASVRTREPASRRWPRCAPTSSRPCAASSRSLTTLTARRRYLATLEASAALRAYERELVHEAERRLRDALVEAWASRPTPPAPRPTRRPPPR